MHKLQKKLQQEQEQSQMKGPVNQWMKIQKQNIEVSDAGGKNRWRKH